MTHCTATQVIYDARVRVTRFDFEPGQDTGWHTHGFDYVITALTDCHMRLEHPDGSATDVIVSSGTSYRRAEGINHNVTNAGKKPMSFVEVELK